MNILALKVDYLKWHYGRAFSDLFSLWGNLFWFLYRYFSVGTVFMTLFSPWQSMGEKYGAWYQIGDFFAALIVNTMMRVVGFVLRSGLLFVALMSFVGLLIFGLVILLFWIFAPIIIAFGILTGIFLIF